MPKYKKARATNLCLCVCDTSNIFLKKMYRKQTCQISNINPSLIQVLKVIVHACPKVGLALGFVGLTYPSCIPNVVSPQVKLAPS